jgi:hypothetical protein
MTGQLQPDRLLRKIDMNEEVVEYLPEVRRTSWDGVKTIDAAHMATALR